MQSLWQCMLFNKPSENLPEICCNWLPLKHLGCTNIKMLITWKLQWWWWEKSNDADDVEADNNEDDDNVKDDDSDIYATGGP